MSNQEQSANYQRGLKLVQEMFGDAFVAGLSAAAESGGFAADCAALAIESAFGAVWSRPGLARRDRSLVTIGILIGTGKPAELKNHVRAGLNNGLSVTELQEVLIQAVPYCGFPAWPRRSRPPSRCCASAAWSTSRSGRRRTGACCDDGRAAPPGAPGTHRCAVERRADGSIVMRLQEPLQPYPRRYTDRLVQWATPCPTAGFLARRPAAGARTPARGRR